MNSKFLVEIIFNQVYTKTDEDGNKSYDSKITTQIYSFEGTNKSSTQYDAQKFMDKVIRYGLELKGGSVLKSIIHPSCILQIGLVDEMLYQKELEAGLEKINVEPTDSGESVGGAVSPDVPATLTEGTGVDLDEAS